MLYCFVYFYLKTSVVPIMAATRSTQGIVWTWCYHSFHWGTKKRSWSLVEYFLFLEFVLPLNASLIPRLLSLYSKSIELCELIH